VANIFDRIKCSTTVLGQDLGYWDSTVRSRVFPSSFLSLIPRSPLVEQLYLLIQSESVAVRGRWLHVDHLWYLFQCYCSFAVCQSENDVDGDLNTCAASNSNFNTLMGCKFEPGECPNATMCAEACTIRAQSESK